MLNLSSKYRREWIKKPSFDQEFNKVKIRKDKQNKLIEEGIKKF
jgi:hypothetical protein|tara:strand:+ start:1114 stop:1245 length:132 start_codon:yes stop_codon:yes gene_type:complete